MAPASAPRQLWVWSLPSLVILLSLVWYKRKRNTLRSDPGGTLKLLPDAADTEQQDIEDKVDHGPPALTRCESTHEADSTNEVVDHTVESVSAVKVEAETVAETVSSAPTSVPVIEALAECKKQVAVHCQVLSAAEVDEKSETLVGVVKAATGSTADSEEPPLAASQEKAVSTSAEMKDSKSAEAPVAPPQDIKDESDKVSSLEGKLASLALGSSEEQRRGAERDSANHSPVDAMLASPSMSSYSDEHSEVSF